MKLAQERKQTESLLTANKAQQAAAQGAQEQVTQEDEDDDHTVSKGAMIFGLVSMSISAITYAMMSRQV